MSKSCFDLLASFVKNDLEKQFSFCSEEKMHITKIIDTEESTLDYRWSHSGYDMEFCLLS